MYFSALGILVLKFGQSPVCLKVRGTQIYNMQWVHDNCPPTNPNAGGQLAYTLDNDDVEFYILSICWVLQNGPMIVE